MKILYSALLQRHHLRAPHIDIGDRHSGEYDAFEVAGAFIQLELPGDRAQGLVALVQVERTGQEVVHPVLLRVGPLNELENLEPQRWFSSADPTGRRAVR